MRRPARWGIPRWELPMFTSWMQRDNRVLSSKRRKDLQAIPQCEGLDERIAPSVTSTFKPANGLLTVRGDAGNNDIVISRTGIGLITVNGKRVATASGFLTVLKVKAITVNGLGGNDNLTISPARGGIAKPATLLGGEGNDVLTGGLGTDVLRGGGGNDTLQGLNGPDVMFGDAGDDLFLWNAGDGNDTVDGGDGSDLLRLTGTVAAEIVSLGGSNGRAFFQGPGGSANTGTTETLELNLLF